MTAGLIDKGFHRWIAQKYRFGTRHRRRFPTLFYLFPWSHREQKSSFRNLVLNTYPSTMLRQLFNRSFHFNYHLHFKLDLFSRSYNTYYFSTSLAHRQKNTREAVIIPWGAGPGSQTAEFPETLDILTLLTMISKEKESGPSPTAFVPMSFLTAWKSEKIYSATGIEGTSAAQLLQGIPLPGKPGISILPPHSMSTIQSASSSPSTYAIQTIQAGYQKSPVHPLYPAHPVHHIHPIPSIFLTHLMHRAHVLQALPAIHQTHFHPQFVPPAARNLFEKKPLRGEAFAERCRRTMLPTTNSLLEYYKYRNVRCFLDFQKLFIHDLSSDHAYLPDSPSMPPGVSPFPHFPVSPFLLFLRAPSPSSRLTKIPFRSLVERLMSVVSVPHLRETNRVPRGTIHGIQTAVLPESPTILTLLTKVAKDKESGPGTFVPMSFHTAGEPGSIYFTWEKQGAKGEQEVLGVPVPGKPGISILPPLHILRTIEAAHSLHTKQSIHKRQLFRPIQPKQRGAHLYFITGEHLQQLLRLPPSQQQAAASFSAAGAVPGSIKTAMEDESTSTALLKWRGEVTVSMLESYLPLIPITLLKPLSTLRTTGFVSPAPIETQKTLRATQSTGTPLKPPMQPTTSIRLMPEGPAIPVSAAVPGAETVPIARTTSIPFAPLIASTTARTARAARITGALGDQETAGTLRSYFTFPAISTIPGAPTVPANSQSTSIPSYGETPLDKESKFDFPGALRGSGPSLEYFKPAIMSRSPSAQAAPIDDIGRKAVPGMPRGDTDHPTHESKNVSIHPDNQGISQQMNVSQLTDRVYRMLERKIRMERERRGW